MRNYHKMRRFKFDSGTITWIRKGNQTEFYIAQIAKGEPGKGRLVRTHTARSPRATIRGLRRKVAEAIENKLRGLE